MSTTRRTLGPMCLLVLLATCSEPAGVPEDDGSELDGLETVACTGLSLAATSGAPMDRIAAGAVPANLTAPLAARVFEGDGSAPGYAWFEVNEDDELEFVTPLHPSGELAGGDVVLRVTDGSVACAPIPFTIEPLPAAPGELAAVVDGLQDVLRLQAAVLETTPEDLMAASIETVDEILLPMAIVQFVLDHPDNDRSLRRIAEGTASLDVPLDLPEALLARSGFRAELEGRLPGPAAAPGAPLATVGVDECTPEAIGENTQRLSDCMNARREITVLFNDFADEAAPTLATAIATMLALDVDGALDVALNTILWTALQEDLATVSTLPWVLTGGDFVVEPQRFTEDDERTGMWSLEVVAESSGWDPTVEALEALLTVRTRQALAKVGVDYDGLSEEVDDLFDGEVTARLPDLEIPVRTFGPVPVSEEAWSQVEYTPFDDGHPLAVEQLEHTTYRPVAVARTRLRVSAPPEPAGDEVKFGGSFFQRARILDVDSIIIHIEPEDTVLAPGAAAVFRVTIENSRFPLDWSVNVSQGTIQTPIRTGDNTFDIPYEAPAEPDFNYRDGVDVRHEAVTGARANGPERTKEAIILFGKVEISPTNFSCQPLSGQRTFTAEVTGPTDESVTWSVDFGTIDQSGVYTAPAQQPAGGTATVRATSNEYEEIFDEVTFTVGCACTYTLGLEGQFVEAEPGDVLSFTTAIESPGDPRRLISVIARRPSESWTANLLPPNSDVSSRPDAPGSWLMRVQGDLGLAEPDVIWSGEVDFNLITFEPPTASGAAIEGSIFGATVQITSTETPREAAFEWFFSMELGPGQIQCTVPEGGGE